MKCSAVLLKHLKASERILVKDITEMEQRLSLDFGNNINIGNIGEYVVREIEIMEAKKRLEQVRADIESLEK